MTREDVMELRAALSAIHPIAHTDGMPPAVRARLDRLAFLHLIEPVPGMRFCWQLTDTGKIALGVHDDEA